MAPMEREPEAPVILDRAPTNAEVFTALALWERMPETRRDLLRPCMLLLAEQQYTWGFALVTVATNADYFARIGPDRSWAAGLRYTDDI